MIVDIHTHPPQFRDTVPPDKVKHQTTWRPDRAVQSTVSWQDYLDAQGPAEKSVVFPIAWHPGETVERTAGVVVEGEDWYDGNFNDATATFVDAYPDRLIGFMSIHPFDVNCMEEFERCRTDLGMRGVKLGANYQDFDPFDVRALRIYTEAQRHGLPLMLHQGTSPVRNAPIRHAHPLLIDELAIRYPDLKIIMAHLGHPWQVETCVVIRKHPNVYTDLSANFYRPFSFWEQMIKAMEWGVTDKIFFGTDFPVTTVQETIDHLYAVNDIVEGTKLPHVPEEIIRGIIHRDSLSLLGLE